MKYYQIAYLYKVFEKKNLLHYIIHRQTNKQTDGQGCPIQAGRQDGEDEVRRSITKSFICTEYSKTKNLLLYLTYRQTNKQTDGQGCPSQAGRQDGDDGG